MNVSDYRLKHLKPLTYIQPRPLIDDDSLIEQPRILTTNNDFTIALANLINTLLLSSATPMELAELVELLIESDVISIVENCLIDSNTMSNVCSFIIDFDANQQAVVKCIVDYNEYEDDEESITTTLTQIHDTLYDVMKIMALVISIVCILVHSFKFVNIPDNITSVFNTYETLNMIITTMMTNDESLTNTLSEFDALGLFRENIKELNNQDNLWVLADMLTNDVRNSILPLMGFIYRYLHILCGKLSDVSNILNIIGLDVSGSMLFEEDQLVTMFDNLLNINYNVHANEMFTDVIYGLVENSVIDECDDTTNPMLCYITLLIIRDDFDDNVSTTFKQAIDVYKKDALETLVD